jgi:hypothetical protein
MRESVAVICPTAKAEYFFKMGWTRTSRKTRSDLPVGSICRACSLHIVIASEAKLSIAPLAEKWIASQ